MLRLGRRLSAGEEGQELVEFALVAPVILAILTGILSFGVIMNQYQMLTLATSDGARAFALSRGQASYSPTTASDPCEYAAAIAQGAAPTLTASNMTINVTYTKPGGSATTYSGVTSSSGCSSLSLGTGDINGTVTVQATYPVNPIIVGWKTTQITLTASSSEQIQ